jgi:hypothetical protein
MAVYEPLARYLRTNSASRIPITFREVERIIGRRLPPSAYRHRPWWANEERGHSHAKAWLQAGYQTEQVDMSGKKLVFRRVSERDTYMSRIGSRGNAPMAVPDAATGEKKPRRHPLFGWMKGTFTIEPGYDLTQPAMPEWADLIDEKYGPEKAK